MARTVDPERHAARRLQILDAALTCFAERGFDRTTTAQVARAAGVGSGTLFHYFPTKAQLLTGLLDLDTEDVRRHFAASAEHAGSDPWSVVLAFVRRTASEVADPRAAGFVAAVVARAGDPAVAAALAANDAAVREGLRDVIARAQEGGAVRTDLEPARLADWVALVLDGFTGRLVADPSFDAAAEADALVDVVERISRPA
jgi:AcrR family transcriptional regulator